MTDIFHAGSAQATTDKAQRAIKAFRSLQPTLTAYARMLSRNPSLRVELSATSNGHTDGKKIYYRPPIALGDNEQHVRSHCDKRDETKQLLCKACAVREDVLVTIYHEIAHICFESMTTVDEYALAKALKKAVEAHGEGYGKLLADRIEQTPIWQRDQYIKLARLVSPFMPLIVNALEDARVNNRLYEARQGTRVMFESMIYRVLTEGVEQVNPETGLPEFIKWNQYPLNPQVIVACLVIAQGYSLEGAFAPQVEIAVNDVVVRRILKTVKTARSVQAIYGISFDLLIRLRELGFCHSDMDPKEPEPEPEREPEDEPEDAEADEDQEGEPEGSSESDGGADEEESDGAPAEADDDGSDDSTSEAVDAGADSEDAGGDEDAQPDAGTGEVGDEASGEAEDQHANGAGDASEATSRQSEVAPEGDQSEEGDGDGNRDSERGESDEDRSESQPDSSDDGGQAADEGEHPDSGASGEGEAKPGSADDGDEVGGDADGDIPDSAGDSTSVGDEGGEDLDDTPSHGEAGGDADSEGSAGGDTEGADGGAQGTHGGTDGLDGDDAGSSVGSDSDAEEPSGVDGQGSDLPAEGVQPDDEVEGDAGEVDPFESGADDGTGGVSIIEDESNDDIPFGSEKDVEAILHQWEGHETPDEIREEANAEEIKALESAITQGMYFETPSRNITGVREHKWGEGLHPNQYRNAWNYPGFDADDQRYYGITGDFDPEERALGPALLRMRVAFSNNQRGSERRHLKSGKVNSRVLGRRAHLGDERLFQKRSLPGKRDYFVLIGMDVSASTAGSNLLLEKQAVMAQANLLNRLGVEFAIYAHSCGWTDRDDGRGGGVSLDIYHVKDANEPFNEATRDRIRSLGPDSGNIDGHTLEFYRKVLDRSTATDRIIMYYTDGKMPAENHNEELEVLQREIKTCKRKGYTLMGVGIRTDSPVRHGLDTVQIDTHEDVVKVVKHLEKRLTSK